MQLFPGLKVGKLLLIGKTVEQRGPKGHNYDIWDCVCECGNKTRIFAQNFNRRGGTRSCGCLANELVGIRSTKHGDSRDLVPRAREYERWCSMHQRCKVDKRYTSRGITVCDRWKSYENFIADVGRRPSDSHTLERINNNKGYEPGNVKWATRREQARNTRRNRIITIDGISKILLEWSEQSGVKQSTIARRLKLGWSPSEAVFTKPRHFSILKRNT